ncbi:DUF6445 family protein [Sphingomonas sp. 28-63-12]|uniref:DUF6445 family protein n=1 Tax=Sphingomonas sp. 28-63-12 TaxID=1970434 RepID=UPI000BCC5F59|nr:MAG: hypothetical protein B7Y47_06305 [Sphingomonas sp. 28-63-12]
MTPRVTVHHIGVEDEPVAVIEDFVPDPAGVRAAAMTAAFDTAGAHYPGIRAAVPPDYLPAIRPVLGKVFREVFGVTEAVSVIDIRLSIVTAAPDSLALEQRLPHVDALEPGRLALVHFLGAGDEDGTAFYRHRTTGFETIDRSRSAVYFAALNADLHRHGPPPPRYLAGDTPIYERIGQFAGCRNRALVYRGRLLHCGQITPDRVLSTDPGQGRLTVTGFFAAR